MKNSYQEAFNLFTRNDFYDDNDILKLGMKLEMIIIFFSTCYFEYRTYRRRINDKKKIGYMAWFINKILTNFG